MGGAGGPTILPGESKGVGAVDANWPYTGDANFTRLKAALDLSIRRFHQSFYTYRSLFWQAPVVRRCLLENRRVWRLWKRIGSIVAMQISFE
jgi:hypothetical protein